MLEKNIKLQNSTLSREDNSCSYNQGKTPKSEVCQSYLKFRQNCNLGQVKLVFVPEQFTDESTEQSAEQPGYSLSEDKDYDKPKPEPDQDQKRKAMAMAVRDTIAFEMGYKQNQEEIFRKIYKPFGMEQNVNDDSDSTLEMVCAKIFFTIQDQFFSVLDISIPTSLPTQPTYTKERMLLNLDSNLNQAFTSITYLYKKVESYIIELTLEFDKEKSIKNKVNQYLYPEQKQPEPLPVKINTIKIKLDTYLYLLEKLQEILRKSFGDNFEQMLDSRIINKTNPKIYSKTHYYV